MRSTLVLMGLLALLSGCASNPSEPGTPPKIDRITPEELESLLPLPIPNLSLEDLVRMSKAGDSPDAIIARIRDSHSGYELTPGQMINLNRQGVDSRVLDYIQSAREQLVREGFADEVNQRERAHREELESLRREWMPRPYSYDPYWPYPNWFYRYPPVLRQH